MVDLSIYLNRLVFVMSTFESVFFKRKEFIPKRSCFTFLWSVAWVMPVMICLHFLFVSLLGCFL